MGEEKEGRSSGKELSVHSDAFLDFHILNLGRLPMLGFELPNKPSKDLPQEMIGEPIMDVVLQVGIAIPANRGLDSRGQRMKWRSSH